jgi:hypothetical protein
MYAKCRAVSYANERHACNSAARETSVWWSGGSPAEGSRVIEVESTKQEVASQASRSPSSVQMNTTPDRGNTNDSAAIKLHNVRSKRSQKRFVTIRLYLTPQVMLVDFVVRLGCAILCTWTKIST